MIIAIGKIVAPKAIDYDIVGMADDELEAEELEVEPDSPNESRVVV